MTICLSCSLRAPSAHGSTPWSRLGRVPMSVRQAGTKGTPALHGRGTPEPARRIHDGRTRPRLLLPVERCPPRQAWGPASTPALISKSLGATITCHGRPGGDGGRRVLSPAGDPFPVPSRPGRQPSLQSSGRCVVSVASQRHDRRGHGAPLGPEGRCGAAKSGNDEGFATGGIAITTPEEDQQNRMRRCVARGTRHVCRGRAPR